MFQDACHDRSAIREARRSASTLERRVRTNQGRSQFRAERFLRLDGSVVKSNFGCWRLHHAHTKRVLAGESTEIFMLLEESQLAHALGGDTARRDVGHGAEAKSRRACAMSICRQDGMPIALFP